MEVVFLLLTGVAFGLAIVMIFARQLMGVLVAFVGIMCLLTALYLLLGAEFVAVAQGLVYVAGFLVLVAFGIAQSPTSVPNATAKRRKVIAQGVIQGITQRIILASPVLSVFILAGLLVAGGYQLRVFRSSSIDRSIQSVQQLGRHILYTNSLLLEILGLILLLSLLGVVISWRSLEDKVA